MRGWTCKQQQAGIPVVGIADERRGGAAWRISNRLSLSSQALPELHCYCISEVCVIDRGGGDVRSRDEIKIVPDVAKKEDPLAFGQASRP